MNFAVVVHFVFGVFLGFVISSSFWFAEKFPSKFSALNLVSTNLTKVNSTFEESKAFLADELFESVKVLCMVMTHPGNHKSKAPHVMKTWGKRCNKLLFVSRAVDPDLPTILLEIPDGREFLWNKTRDAYEYVYRHHLDDADWFMKVDDDSYLVMENLRQLLFSYDSNRSLILGHKFFVKKKFESGYMSGGAYILSKAAVKKLVEKILPNNEDCRNGQSGVEDWSMGRCLTNHAIFVDTRDEMQQLRFFPLGVKTHLGKELKKESWYSHYQYFNVSQGNLRCCSDTFTQSHYIGKPEMYLLEYLIYNVVPFGFDRNFNETLPRKFTFDEVKKAGKAKSFQQQ